MKYYLLSIITSIFFFLSSLINAQTCEDTNNGVLNPWGYDCSFYNNNIEDCDVYDGIYYQGGTDYTDEFGYTEFVAYEMCCECGGGTDYPYPYDCQDNETAINFYGGGSLYDIGWEIQNCDGSTFLSGGAPFFDCVELPSDGYQVVVTDAAANGWQMDTSIGAYGTLQIGDQDYGLLSGGYDLHIGTCGSCQDGQEYIDLFVGTWNNPWEMTWEILDSNGNLVISGDGYTADGCYDVPCPYTINMFDSQGDGWVAGNNPDAGNITIGDQVYTVYSGYVELDGVLWLMDGNSQSDTYNDCTINISEDCENTDNGEVDSYGDDCSSWYDANEYPGSSGCTGQYDTDSFIAVEMCCACGGGSEPLCDEGYEIDANGNCVFGSLGCTGSGASNYDPEATVDDGSCVFSNCINEYTSYGVANCDDAVINLGWTCEGLEAEFGFDCSGCNCGDGSVFCTDATACNFGEEGECTFATELVDCDGNSTCDGTWVENTTYGPCSAYNNNLSYCNTIEGCYSYSYPVFGCFFCPNIEGCGGSFVVDTEYVCEDGSGCTDSNACNYNSSATQDNGACTYPNLGYDCNGVCINDADSDGVCDDDEILGCTDSVACNYSSNATDDNNSCSFADEGYDCDGNLLEECVNDDSVGDSYGDTCSDWYDANPFGCGNYDTESFIASEMCCACGGGSNFQNLNCTDQGACNYGEEGDCIFADNGYDCDGEQIIFGCTDETAFNYNENATSLPSGEIIPGGSCNLDIWGQNYFGVDPDWYFDGNQNTFATGNKLYIGDYTFYVDFVSEYQDNCNAPAVLVYVVTNPDGTTTSPINVNAVVGENWYMDPCGVIVEGCTDSEADNYNQYATNDDDSCSYIVGNCTGTIITMGGGSGLSETSWSIQNCLGGILVSESGDVNGDDSPYTICSDILPNVYKVVTGDENGNTWNGNILTIDGVEFTGPSQGCSTDPTNALWNPGGISCQEVVVFGNCYGCTDVTACNYDTDATFNDVVTCVYPGSGYDCEGNSICDDNWVENISYGNCSDYSLDECSSIVGIYGTSCDIQGVMGGGIFCEGVNPLDNGWDLVLEDNSYCDTGNNCTDTTACNYQSEGECIYTDADGDGVCDDDEILGCTDSVACNYNTDATNDDGSCVFAQDGFDCDGNIIPECQDTNFGATDDYGDGCVEYNSNPEWCGNYDTVTFNSLEMCCICDGGGIDPINSISGCTDIAACNYNIDATNDDGSCEYYYPIVSTGLQSLFDCNGNCITDSDGDGVCDEIEAAGCTNPIYLEYFPPATEDDGSCLTIIDAGCLDSLACNYNPSFNTEDNSSCLYANIYNCNDNSCINDEDGDGICDELEIFGCTDESACNFNYLAENSDDSCIYNSVNYDCNGLCINDIDNDGICDENEITIDQDQFNECGGRYLNQIFQNVEVQTDIVYSEEHDLKLDVYQGSGDTMIEERPLLIYAYGGGFLNGSKEQAEAVSFANYFAKRGYVVATIDYRIFSQEIFGEMISCGEITEFCWPFPYFCIPTGFDACYEPEDIQTYFFDAIGKAISDGKSAVRFFRKSYAEENNQYKIDPDQIFWAGWSAGGIIGAANYFIDENEFSDLDEPNLINPINANGGFNGNSGNYGYSHLANGIIGIGTGIFNDPSTFISENDSDKIYIQVHGSQDEIINPNCNSTSIWSSIGSFFSEFLTDQEIGVVSGLTSTEFDMCGGFSIQNFAEQNNFPNFHLLSIEGGGHTFNEEAFPFTNSWGENGERYMHDWIASKLYPYLDATEQCIVGCTDSNYFEYNENANLLGVSSSMQTSTTNIFAPIDYQFPTSDCLNTANGCMDELACNYNSEAIFEDSCIYIESNDNCSVCSGESNGTGTVIDNDIDNDGVCDDDEILGCQDSNACNYNSLATDQDNCIFTDQTCDTCSGEIDGTGFVINNDLDNDGICDLEDVCPNDPENDSDGDGICESDEIIGCQDATACNYNENATDEDGSCIYVAGVCDTCSGELNGTGTVVDNDADDDGVCDDDEVLGCPDMLACNYDNTVTDDDNSCIYPAQNYLDCNGACLNDNDGDGTCDELEILGCTDSTAFNYNLDATEDDDSCMPIIFGCIDSMYLEFNLAANTDDGTCEYLVVLGCTDNSYTEYNASANTDDGTCTTLVVLGCTDASYTEYNSSANTDDGTCTTLVVLGCTDNSYTEYDSTANTDDGTCNELEILGCTDNSYTEYDTTANTDDGSCSNLIILGCTNESYFEYDLSANLDDGSCDNLIVLGCTNPEAANYNLSANTDDDSCEFSPFDVIQTDCNMTVLLPADLNISLNGEQITSSVWIGVTDGDGIVCGEALFNPGDVNSVIVWDESNSSYGMLIGETLNWVAMIDGEMTSGEALYQPWGYDEFACNGLSGITSLNFISSSTFSQEIELEAGWGIWSTYINSENPDMINIFSDIVDDLTIVKDETGLVYWPAFNLNTIGDLTEGKGYQVKMINPATLIIEGTLVPIDTELTLTQGWSIMGYLDQNCNSAENMMAPIFNELIILKNETGLVYWPTFNLNSIGDMCPDKGYQVKMNEVSSFNYSSTSNTSRYGDLFVERPIHFEEPTNTGNNMIIGLPLTSWESTPSIGDEIAAYGEDGTLIGSTTFQGDHIALTIWGDDLTTDKKDGISEGESISFKLWNSQTGIEQALDLRWSQGFGFYTADGISIVGQITLGSELASDKKLVRITDMLGREVNENEKDVMLLYIYDDGSIEREYIKE